MKTKTPQSKRPTNFGNNNAQFCLKAQQSHYVSQLCNIRFWLDPLEHKRRGTKFSVSSPSLGSPSGSGFIGNGGFEAV
ncbi:hypothetical protein FCV25MIE_16673 [Fagus crenata]